MTCWLTLCKWSIIADRNLMLCFTPDCRRLPSTDNRLKSNLNGLVKCNMELKRIRMGKDARHISSVEKGLNQTADSTLYLTVTWSAENDILPSLFSFPICRKFETSSIAIARKLYCDDGHVSLFIFKYIESTAQSSNSNDISRSWRWKLGKIKQNGVNEMDRFRYREVISTFIDVSYGSLRINVSIRVGNFTTWLRTLVAYLFPKTYKKRNLATRLPAIRIFNPNDAHEKIK